jgi:hypothetical protein
MDRLDAIHRDGITASGTARAALVVMVPGNECSHLCARPRWRARHLVLFTGSETARRSCRCAHALPIAVSLGEDEHPRQP